MGPAPSQDTPRRLSEWTVVVPVKLLFRAKSRLAPGLDASTHGTLVRSLVLDTVEAITTAGPAALVVVSSDPWAKATLPGLGCRVLPDTPDAGLNDALRHVGATMRAESPETWVAAMGSDLPALRPTELTRALTAARAAPGRTFVVDAAGTGTTLLCKPANRELDPRFGPGSRARHLASGAVELTGAWPGLRQDVDTAGDLASAVALGIGPRTRALLAELSVPDPALPGFGCLDGTPVVTLSATVRRGSATDDTDLVLDSGATVTLPSQVALHGVRQLRAGQRVSVLVDLSGAVRRVGIVPGSGLEPGSMQRS